MNTLLGQLTIIVFELCLQWEEFVNLEFRGHMSNLPGFGPHLQRFLTPVQLNLAYNFQDLQTAIGVLQGALHIDSGDGKVWFTIFVLILACPDPNRKSLRFASPI